MGRGGRCVVLLGGVLVAALLATSAGNASGAATSDLRSAQAEEPAPASLTPVSESYGWRWTRCATPCLLGDVVGSTERQRTIFLVPTHPSAEPVTATAATLVLNGEQHPEPVVADEVAFTPAADGHARVVVTLPDLQPDSYSGSVVIDVATGAPPVIIPVTLEVREGLLWPLIVLVAAVVLGAIATAISGLDSRRRFADRCRSLRDTVRGLTEADRAIVEPLLDATWNARGANFAVANAHLTALQHGTAALATARAARTQLLEELGSRPWPVWMARVARAHHAIIYTVRSYGDSYDANVADLQREIDGCLLAADARDCADLLTQRARAAQQHPTLADPYDRFTTAVMNLTAALEGIDPDITHPTPDLDSLLQHVKDRFDDLETAFRQRTGSPLPTPTAPRIVPTGVAGAPAEAAAAPEIPPTSNWAFDARVLLSRFIGPLVALLIPLVLLAVGLKVSYLDNATFGATITDWIGLAIWGIAAYGARYTLTGIAKPS